MYKTIEIPRNVQKLIDAAEACGLEAKMHYDDSDYPVHCVDIRGRFGAHSVWIYWHTRNGRATVNCHLFRMFPTKRYKQVKKITQRDARGWIDIISA